MPLDPELDVILQLINDVPPLRESTPEQARANLRLFTVDLRDPATKADVSSVEEVTYPAAEGARSARVYRPAVKGPVPTIVFVHGGGYVIGDLDTHDDHARLLCAEVGAVVVSIDYRLAPENPFPAGYLDCLAALRHVFDIVDELGGDPGRIAVAGDSAGGNLSAGMAIAARDEGLALKAQLLLYPGTDFTDSDAHPSRTDNAEGFLLTADDARWFRDQYASHPEDPRASVLLHNDLVGVAPTVLATAELDPLRDEGEAYAAALSSAGVKVIVRRYDSLIHGFFGLTHLSATADRASRELCADLKELLG